MTWYEIVAFGLLFGLANAAHCAGMCGVFSIRSVMGASRPVAAAGRFAGYAAGKTFTYTSLGAVFGALGARIGGLGGPWQAGIAIGAACFIILAGLSAWIPAVRSRAAASGVVRHLAAFTRSMTQSGLPGGVFTLGAATGLLPCGIVWIALLESGALASPLRGWVLMAAFGVGTLPVLALIAFIGEPLLRRLGPSRIRWIGGTLLLIGGAWALYRAVITVFGNAAAGGPACCH